MIPIVLAGIARASQFAARSASSLGRDVARGALGGLTGGIRVTLEDHGSMRKGIRIMDAHLASVRQLTRAINRAATSARAVAARELSGPLALGVSTVRARIRFQRANAARLRARLVFPGGRIRLSSYRVVQTHKGVKGKIPYAIFEARSGRQVSAEELRKAFTKTPRSSRNNIFLRAGQARYPIDVIVAPSLGEAFVKYDLGSKLGRVVAERIRTVLDQEIKRRLPS